MTLHDEPARAAGGGRPGRPRGLGRPGEVALGLIPAQRRTLGRPLSPRPAAAVTATAPGHSPIIPSPLPVTAGRSPRADIRGAATAVGQPGHDLLARRADHLITSTFHAVRAIYARFCPGLSAPIA
jgi:hypothetical protein